MTRTHLIEDEVYDLQLKVNKVKAELSNVSIKALKKKAHAVSSLEPLCNTDYIHKGIDELETIFSRKKYNLPPEASSVIWTDLDYYNLDLGNRKYIRSMATCYALGIEYLPIEKFILTLSIEDQAYFLEYYRFELLNEFKEKSLTKEKYLKIRGAICLLYKKIEACLGIKHVLSIPLFKSNIHFIDLLNSVVKNLRLSYPLQLLANLKLLKNEQLIFTIVN